MAFGFKCADNIGHAYEYWKSITRDYYRKWVECEGRVFKMASSMDSLHLIRNQRTRTFSISTDFVSLCLIFGLCCHLDDFLLTSEPES